MTQRLFPLVRDDGEEEEDDRDEDEGEEDAPFREEEEDAGDAGQEDPTEVESVMISMTPLSLSSLL